MAKYGLSCTITGVGVPAVAGAASRYLTATVTGVGVASGSPSARRYLAATITGLGVAAAAAATTFCRTAATTGAGIVGVARAASYYRAALITGAASVVAGKEGDYHATATVRGAGVVGGWTWRAAVARFNLTFMGLFGKRPSNVAARVRVRAVVEAFRQRLLAGQTLGNAAFWAVFIPLASGEALDRWGELKELARDPGESDVVYRARLLVAFRAGFSALTEQALKDALDAVGGPACTEVIHHWRSRWLWSKGSGYGGVLPWSVFGRGAPGRMPGRLGLFTCSAVLASAPGAEETTALAAAARAVIPATVRLLLVTYDAVNGVYILHGEVYRVPHAQPL